MHFKRYLYESEFLASTGHSGFDLDNAYNLISQSYNKSIGNSWSKEKFLKRVKNWDFYGDQSGFVAVRQQHSGPIKLVATAGDLNGIMVGMADITKLNKPIWGATTPKIVSVIAKKYNLVFVDDNQKKKLLNDDNPYPIFVEMWKAWKIDHLNESYIIKHIRSILFGCKL